MMYRAFLLGALILAIPAPAAFSADLYVDDDGLCGGMSPCYTDLQTAIGAALDGDTIHVSEGVYTPAATVDLDVANLTILGPQAEIDPRPSFGSSRTPGSAAEAIIDGGGTLGIILSVQAAGIEIDGLEVRNGTGDLLDQGAAYPLTTVRYCIVHDSSGDEGVQLRGVNGGLMEYNYVYNTYGDGLNFANGSVGCTIRYCEITNVQTTHGGIYVYTSDDMEIYGNLIYNIPNGSGIKTYHNGDTWIYDNELHNAAGAGYLSSSDFDAGSGGPGTITVEHNEVHSCGYGLYFERPYSGGDYAVHENNLAGNTFGAEFYLRSGAPYMVNLEDNWWGDASGPLDLDGSVEVPPCHDADPTLQLNADGTGTSISGQYPGEDQYLDYCPWLTEPWAEATPTPPPTPTFEPLPTHTPTPTLSPTATLSPTPTPIPPVPATGPAGAALLLAAASVLLIRRRK